MDYYKIRLKLAKNTLPKLKDEELQWQAIKNLVKNGQGQISSMSKSDEEFSRPEGLQQFPEWNKKFTTDYYLDFSILLTDEEAENIELLSKKLYEDLQKCNMLNYSYQIESGRFESWGFFNASEFEEIEGADKSKNASEEKKAAKQIDMFKGKRKSK